MRVKKSLSTQVSAHHTRSPNIRLGRLMWFVSLKKQLGSCVASNRCRDTLVLVEVGSKTEVRQFEE